MNRRAILALMLLLAAGLEPTSARLFRGGAGVTGGAYTGNLPVNQYVVNTSSSTVTDPYVQLPQPLGDNDLPSGQTLTATAPGGAMTFTPARVASGQASTPAFVDVMGQISATIPGSVAITSLTATGGVATAATAAAHSLTAGTSYVVIKGADQAGYDGLFLVQSTPTTTTFTYNQRGFANTNNQSSSFASPATGSPTLYYTAPVALNHTAGSFNTTLPGGKTAADIVADIQAHMDDVGLTFKNVVTMGGPGNADFSLGSGNWTADANWGFNAGTTPAETGYYRVKSTGPASADFEVDVPLVDQTTYTPSAFTVSGNLATITVANDLQNGGSFSGSIAGTTLTADGGTPNTIAQGQTIVTSTGAHAKIASYGSGTGANGTYTLDTNLGTVADGTINITGQWVKFAGMTPSNCNGYAQVVSATLTNFTIVAPAGCTSPSVIGTMQVLENNLWMELHETAWLNTSTGAVTGLRFKAYLNEGKRLRQNITATGNLALTLNGTAVRSWGGNPGDGNTLSFAPSAVNTGTGDITVANSVAGGQAMTVSCTGGGCTVPAPLMAANTAIPSETVDTSTCPSYAKVTITINNSLFGSADFVRQFITISGATPPQLNGKWALYTDPNTGIGTDATHLQFLAPCAGLTGGSVASPGTVTPTYYASATPTTVKLWNVQDGGNRQISGTITLTSQGTGTITLTGNTTIYPYTRNLLSGTDMDWDWDNGTGALNANKPAVFVVSDMDYCIKVWRCPPIDRTVVMTSPTDIGAPLYAPDTFCAADPGFNTPGENRSYGVPFNEWQARRLSEPWDWAGYVQRAKACAVVMGGATFNTVDESNYRIIDPSGPPRSTYSGLNRYPNAFRDNQGAISSAWSSDFPSPTITIDWIGGFNAEVTHWYQNTLGNYIMSGGDADYTALVDEAGAMALNTFSTLNFLYGRVWVPAGGSTIYTSVVTGEPRSNSPTFTLSVGGAVFAADGTSEKSFLVDTMNDDITYYNTNAAATVAYNPNANISSNLGMYPSVGRGPPNGTYSNISTGIACCGDASQQSLFEESYNTISFAYDYGLWPSSTMTTLAQKVGRFVHMMDSDWSCQAAIGGYVSRFVSPPPLDSPGSPTNNFLAENDVGPQIGWEGEWLSADGSHILITSNYADFAGGAYSPPFQSGDKIVLDDSDYHDGQLPGVAVTGPSAPVLNTFYYLQGPALSPFSNHVVQATLSTDAAGLSPVTWTGNTYGNSTLATALTDTTGTTVALSSGITFPSADLLGYDLIQIDNELMIVHSRGTGLTSLVVDRGSFGSIAATHSAGATVQRYSKTALYSSLQNRTGGNCPSQLIFGTHSNPGYDSAGKVSFGYFTLPWTASQYFAHYGFYSAAGANRMTTLFHSEDNNVDGCHGMTGFAQCSGGTLEFSATPN